MYALIDCNNFFASCEKIFNPSLEGKPLVILSNNDGCIIARSDEAKALNIPMGAPYFKWRNVIEENNVAVFSSNYELYGDISNRVMSIIALLAKNKYYEIYSIDEAFISLEQIPKDDILEFVLDLQAKIQKWVGIRTSIGIGQSKTLAKAANFIAKKKPVLCIYDNIFDLRDKDIQSNILSLMRLENIWGISFRLAEKLGFAGIRNAKDLRDADSKILRQSFGVIMEKMIMELRGISSIGLDNHKDPKKNIMSSRSFGKAITSLTLLEESIASYVANACTRLREQGSKASGIYVILKVNKYHIKDPTDKSYKYAKSLYFMSPSADTSYITKIAKQLLKELYISGLQYKKAGIMLLDCKESSSIQRSFFEENDEERGDELMSLMDKTNARFGKATLHFAAEGTKSSKSTWQMKRELKSPSYSSYWDDLVRVR